MGYRVYGAVLPICACCLSAPRPSERQYKEKRELVAKDFCGWSALGPISMFIENVLGFYNIDANKGLVEWKKRGGGEQGLRNLHFGHTVTDIVANGNVATVKSNRPYTLMINKIKYRVKAGEQTITLNGLSVLPLGRVCYSFRRSY